MTAAKRVFKVLTGLNVPGKRFEVGDVTDAIPVESIGWLLAQGHIEPVDGKPKTMPEEMP